MIPLPSIAHACARACACARALACALLPVLALACDPATGTGYGTGTSRPTTAAAASPTRAPTFVSPKSKPVYDRAIEEMRAVDTMRGSAMTDALATDLGFKCADLKELRKQLATEPDPVVWKLRSRIDKTCDYDAPIASALLAIDRIQKKRAADASADVAGECRSLKLALADLGTGYLANPTASDVIAKETTLCEGSDTVRRIPY